MMNSGQQTPQVSSLTSQPQEMTNEPQEMQQGRTSQCHTGRQVMTVPQHVQKKSSQSPQGPKDQQTLPHQAPDVPPMPLQMLRPMPAPEQTRQVIQHVLQQRPQEVCTSQQTSQMSQQEKQQMKTVCQKMQQAKTMQHQILVATVSKKVHASTGRSTPAPVMAAPQQVLGETPLRRHVSETHRKQGITTLQQMQVKTQQHQKQQEMTELLNREGSTLAPVMVAQQQVLGQTPVRQHVLETSKTQWTDTLQQMQVKTQQHQKQQEMSELLNRKGSTPAPVMVAQQQVLGQTLVRQHVLETSKTQWTDTLQQMQVKTQQHQKQQEMTELLNRERATPAPVMAAPQQVLGETPVRQHVSESHRKQGITTLQQMQVKTQQHQKQQEMTELLNREGSTPAPVMVAQQQVLGQTPVRQHVSETSKTQWTDTLQQMQVKTQQHQKQQEMTELLNRERATPAPVMAAPQQVLGETPVRQHVSDTHRKQGITTLRQMHVKTQQHQKQQEMTELLNRERSTPAPVMAAPQQVLGETPLRQHVPEAHRKQGITTLQQMQVKTQQHQKQLEMTELLHRERSTPAPVIAAPRQVLGGTLLRQHVLETRRRHGTTTLQQMQVKTQQHQKQQKMTELLHRERPTAAPVMAAPQQSLGETPVRQHVSETQPTQRTTTLEQMQEKIQQHQKFQEMAELLHREGVSPLKLVAVVTSLPTQQRALHVFLIPKHALQPTPTQQKAKVEMKASQEKPKMTTPLQQNPRVHPTSSKMHILQRLHKELTAFLQEVQFSSVLELLSLAPMLFPKPPSKGSFGNIASGSDNVKKRNDGIQNQL
ncbi:mediator of RNA polymerase II transcription subunit 15-like [Schistocerca piceifrons]|uniref:mediator of RNA polymerase II transcription subunit 15-like n=1 Tax=Schistocerca piceifrons TaxID=274613 RepID=UPI001F5F79E2|nr:mediator of RNA polymerase II transcription subunit 15-like [Schistocerca piceifrons]